MSRIHIDVRDKAYGSKRGNAKLRSTIEHFVLDVESGEFVCLVGPSGCGKTTLLNIIAGLDVEFEGSVSAEPTAHHEISMAYVFQEPRLLPWRTIIENIQLVLPEGGKHELTEHLLDVMDLSAVKQHYPEHVSLGMSRRVALVRALVTEPNLLLMDEPFVSLDAPTARRIRKLLLVVWRERPHTVLFVTHDLDEAIYLANRIIFLSPNPMRIAASVPVDIPYEDRGDEASIRKFRSDLLERFPQVAGLI